MDVTNAKIARTITWIAAGIALIVAMALPFIYFISTYQTEVAIMVTEAEISSQVASQIVNANPELWRFQQSKLAEFLTRRPRQSVREARRIIDLNGKLIAENLEISSHPIIWRSADILDAGVPVGHIEIGRSLLPLLLKTAGLALLGVLIGGVIFVALRVLPLRALDRAMAENFRLIDELKRGQAELSIE